MGDQPMTTRRRLLGAALALPGLGSASGPAGAQDSGWPDRPVRMIVPFPPGRPPTSSRG
jgi:tripartite-type tricarboxylate transporter receptor subunit TctC